MADVFISYPHEYRQLAEAIAIRLLNDGNSVFWDTDLIPAESFDKRIRKEIRSAKRVIFLVCPEFLGEGRYAKTELGLVKKKWPNPAGRVLPVVVSSLQNEDIPIYLSSVHMLYPSGDVASETADAFKAMRHGRSKVMPISLALFVFAIGAAWVTDHLPVPADYRLEALLEGFDTPKPSPYVVTHTYVCNMHTDASDDTSCAFLAQDVCTGFGYDGGRVLTPKRDYTPNNDSPNWRGERVSCWND